MLSPLWLRYALGFVTWVVGRVSNVAECKMAPEAAACSRLRARAAVGYPCVHVLEHCGWDGGRPYKQLYFVGFFVGVTAFLAGALAFVLIAMKFVATKMWALLRS